MNTHVRSYVINTHVCTVYMEWPYKETVFISCSPRERADLFDNCSLQNSSLLSHSLLHLFHHTQFISHLHTPFLHAYSHTTSHSILRHSLPHPLLYARSLPLYQYTCLNISFVTLNVTSPSHSLLHPFFHARSHISSVPLTPTFFCIVV